MNGYVRPHMPYLVFRNWAWGKKQILWDPSEVLRKVTSLAADGYSGDEVLMYLHLDRITQEKVEGL